MRHPMRGRVVREHRDTTEERRLSTEHVPSQAQPLEHGGCSQQ